MIGSLGIPELLFILALALLIFGPRKLPEIGKTLGKALGEFRRATTDLKRTLDVELSAQDLKESPSTRKDAAAATAPQGPVEQTATRTTGEAEAKAAPEASSGAESADD